MTKRQILCIFGPATLVLTVLVCVRLFCDVRFPAMTRDPAAITGTHPLLGVLSHLGVLLWCASAVVCLYTAWLHPGPRTSRPVRFLLVSGLLSAYFTLDDLFLIHEHLIPKYTGVWEKAVYAAIAGAVVVYLYSFRKILMQTPVTLLVLALMFLAASMAVDAVLARFLNAMGDWHVLLEDGAKWLGIAGWCGYFVLTARQFATVRTAPAL